VEVIAALRRARMTGPEIAEILGMATSTVSAVLKRIGLGRLSRLAPPEPVRRYERSRPGELLHIDVKKLGRISAKGAGHRVPGEAGGVVDADVDPLPAGGATAAVATAPHPAAAISGLCPERAAALSGWLERYNLSRRHGVLGHRPPIERLRELQGNNVAGLYT